MTMGHPCILCGETETKPHRLDGAAIRRSLMEYFGSALPDNLSIRDYDMLECGNCGLVSACPMIPGDDAFYKWITSHANYYPSFRWEWRSVVEQISRAAQSRPISILDIGCGSGDFLSLVHGIRHVEAWGADTTKTSIEAAKARGLNAVCADMNEFRSLKPDAKFDFVTSFHCIEHVENPISFLHQIKELLKPDVGVALVSAPLSPMSFEYGWFDPLNHPPHHLSRWSERALQKLAEITGFGVIITASPPGSNIYRALHSLMLAKVGVLQSRGGIQKLVLAARYFPDFLKECIVQSRRPRICGRTAGDTFLAALTPLESATARRKSA
jgi:2-polyprenyl-3-methyl-5-hydroxy-6-metoxy-1,4-benzoquinol methylase